MNVSIKLRNDLIEENYSIVRNVVNSMRARLPRYADLDELHSVGVSGLISAAKRYDQSKKDTFKGYVALRVKGAILDELRRMDAMPRSTRAKLKQIEAIKDSYLQENGVQASDEHIRNVLGVSSKAYSKIKARVNSISFIALDKTTPDSDSLHETIQDESAKSAFENIQKKETLELLSQKINELDQRSRKILQMYYLDEKKFFEIAKELDLTEARISQIHAKALLLLREKMISEL